MEENDDALEEWRDFMGSPKGMGSVFVKHELHSAGMSGFGDNDERALENSELNFEVECENGGIGVIGLENQAVSGAVSIAERRAAKFGFDAAKISSNTPRFRFSSPLASPGAQSPYLTIPGGISPSVLLDSPIMLPNPLPSPTTGTFAIPDLLHDFMMANSMMNSASYDGDGDRGQENGSSFRFKPQVGPVSLACFSGQHNQNYSVDSLASGQAPAEFGFPARFLGETSVQTFDSDSPSDTKLSNDLAMNADSAAVQNSHSDNISGAEMRNNRESVPEDMIADQSTEVDLKGTHLSMGSVRSSEDGYNWRKYGQKQVKGSEYPRSYYKCTHPHCPVKKKVERSRDGQITEIIYKGNHNHSKPQPSRRSTFASGLPFGESSEIGEGNTSCGRTDGGPVWRSLPYGYKDFKGGADGLERTCSTSVVTEISDPMSATQAKQLGLVESVGTPELSSTLASHEDEEEDAATQGSLSLGDDDDNDPESKRRKKENSLIEATLGSRAVREPRVVVQIESEVDILDDGYRWRKYGQKVVKGNPNPRSYYKCTSAGCTVRKHVERASHNMKCVITAYEGKHNHEVPAARNSSHSNSGGGNLPPTAPNTQTSLALPRSSHLPKPEPQDLAPHFDRKMEYNNQFFRPNFLANFGRAPAHFYPMRFPSLPGTTPFGSMGLGLNPPNYEAYRGPTVPAVPDISMPLPMAFSRPSNYPVASYGNNEGPIAPVRAFYSTQELNDSDAKLLRPKKEEVDDGFYDNSVPSIDQINLSASTSVYQHTMGNFPP